MNDFERCKKYKPSIDRVCELSLVDRFLWCDGCNHFVQPDHPGLEMQRKADKEKFADLLASFPPFHGEWNGYTKREVEDWLAKARKAIQ